LLTVGGVRGAVTLAGVMSVPMLMGGEVFAQRDLLIFIAAGVILLSLIAACIALPMLLRGIETSPDDKRRNEVRDAWRKTAEAAIHALEAEEVNPPGRRSVRVGGRAQGADHVRVPTSVGGVQRFR
jgi:CPA1 family monovalent cation:H+ antiporter